MYNIKPSIQYIYITSSNDKEFNSVMDTANALKFSNFGKVYGIKGDPSYKTNIKDLTVT